MAQIKIYGTASFIRQYRSAISDTIHSCIVDALAYPQDKRAHRFFPLESEDFIYPLGRSDRYIIIEISMFEGRTTATKKKLIYTLFDSLLEKVGITPNDVEITITETPKHNWGIRGKTGDELELNYKVEL
ncbi:MAG: tautomerase family protein [Hapalosiphonaceae cyanobacterium JJU2]|nr:MAG: tautomerase family protein [Hapalosiphonaceae cyanobacterium JJU2]